MAERSGDVGNGDVPETGDEHDDEGDSVAAAPSRARTVGGIAIIVFALIAVIAGGATLLVGQINEVPLKWETLADQPSLSTERAPTTRSGGLTTNPTTDSSPSRPPLGRYREPPRDRSSIPNNSWLSAARATPGMTIAQPDGDALDTCTLALFGKRSGDTVAITASYCRRAGDEVFYKTSRQPTTMHLASTLPFGEYTHVEQGALDGVGVITVTEGVQINPKVGNRIRIRGLLDPRELRTGMQICKYGYRTQETCGNITAVTPTSVIADLYTRRGDAGGLAYIKTSATTAYAVGVQSGRLNEPAEAETSVRFAYLKPLFDDYGIDPITS